jgi:hypothetical protein
MSASQELNNAVINGINRMTDLVNRNIDAAAATAVRVINNCIAGSTTLNGVMNCIENIEDPDLRNFTKQIFIERYAASLGFTGLDWDGLRKIARSPYALAYYILEKTSNQTQQQNPTPQAPQQSTQNQARPLATSV